MTVTVPDQLKPSWWMRPWRILPEPRIVSALMVGVYLVFAVMGLAWYIDPQDVVVIDRLGVAGGYITGTLWLVGGVCGLVSLRPGYWWLERAGLLLVMAALVGRGLIVSNLAAEPGEWVIREGIIAVVVLGLIVRLVRIMGLAADPTKGR